MDILDCVDDDGKDSCEICHGRFYLKGLPNHRASCRRQQQRAAEDRELERAVATDAPRHLDRPRSESEVESWAQREFSEEQPMQASDSEDEEGETDNNGPPASGLLRLESLRSSDVSVNTSGRQPSRLDPVDEFNRLPQSHPIRKTGPRLDDIMTVYHPASGLLPDIQHFEDYGRKAEDEHPLPLRENPWTPFQSRIDFEVAQFATEAHLSRPLIERLLAILKIVATGKSGFSLESYKAWESAWDKAVHHHPPFEHHTITSTYKREELSFDLYSRPLWSWVLNQLSNPELVPHTSWDAQQMFKFNGREWVRFIHEPKTANRWWSIQSKLPPGGKPLCLILYADKTRLSSFGTAKGYPVIARIANFDRNIRNSEGIGGGRVVGWLPVVGDPADKKNKTTYTNFKRIVWHQSFLKILETIIGYSKDGYAFRCADNIVRILFPLVLILSADYEEHCVMALIRGQNGKCPCPVCYIPSECLADLNQNYPMRKAADGQAILTNDSLNRTEKAAQLKELGLRAVQNAFWSVKNSDPHEAVSFDELHANKIGVFGKHIWVEIGEETKSLGRVASGKIDAQMDALPPWRNLNHFSNVMEVHFADGRKYEDISKVFIFAAHNILTPHASEAGYALLKCLRSYIEHDMYLALEVHTEETLAAGRRALSRFSSRIREYSQIRPSKSWSFPKNHAQHHAYHDIEEKGVLANSSTRPNEKCHGPFKDTYDLQTNNKNVAPQLLRVEHRLLVCMTIKQHIADLDEHEKSLKNLKKQLLPSLRFMNIYLGAPQEATTAHRIEFDSSHDEHFANFRQKLTSFINASFPRPDQKWMALPKEFAIQECRFLKVDYESMVTWKLVTDYLRCSPSFHGSPRHDGVIINEGKGHYSFGILMFLFVCDIAHLTPPKTPLALVYPLSPVIGSRARKDKDLGLYRVRGGRRDSCRVIPARCVLRGAYLVKDPDVHSDYFAVDTVDTDMFLRLQTIFQHRS